MPTYHACIVEAELRARAAYAAPTRHYHDQRHLDSCLDRLARVTGLSEREERLLRWAILWHDAIYDPERRDNEERSAEEARRELLACGVDTNEADEVARLILLTKSHRAHESDRLGALLVSIDFAILGSEPDLYREYVANVRREYAHVRDDQWRTGRAAVLERLLESDHLYPDPAIRSELADQARRNMRQELRALRGG